MLSLRIALRYLFSKKSHQAVNIISYVSMAGVALASAAMIIVLSVFNGFSDFTADSLSSVAADMVILPAEGKTIAQADDLAAELAAVPGIANATPVISEKAFAIAGDLQMPLTIKGVPSDDPLTSTLSESIIDGVAMVDMIDGTQATAIASVGVANGLRSVPSLESIVKIYEPRRLGRINPANPMNAFRADSVMIAGVFRSDREEFDADMLIVPIEVARNLLDYTDESTSIELRLSPGTTPATVKGIIADLYGDSFTVKDKIEQHEQAFRMIKIEKWVTLLMLTFILLIASFNILSTMSMLIVEKRSNMAIMTALGAPRRMIARTFATLGFLIAAIGGAIGLAVGTSLSLAQQFGGFIKLNANDMSSMAITSYPVHVSISDLLIVAAIIAVTGAATALITSATLRR